MARKPPPKMNCQKDAKGRFLKGTCVPAGGSRPVVAKPKPKSKPRARRQAFNDVDDFSPRFQTFAGVGNGGNTKGTSSLGSTLLFVFGLGAAVLGGIVAYRRYYETKQLAVAKSAKTDPATAVRQGIEIATNLTAGGHTPSAAMPTEDAVASASIGGKVIPIRPL